MKPSEELAKREWIKGVFFKAQEKSGLRIIFDTSNSEACKRNDLIILGCCIAGACHIAARTDREYREMIDNKLDPVLQKRYGKKSPGVAIVNDEILTSKEEAIALLQEAGL